MNAEMYSEPSQTYSMEPFTEVVNSYKSLINSVNILRYYIGFCKRLVKL